MKSTGRAIALLATGLSIAWVVTYAADLGSRDARRAVAEALSLDDAAGIRVRSISEGMGGQAVVETTIDAAFRFEKGKGGRWSAVEVRTGNQKWESIELIQTAVRKEKVLRTTADMRTIATALEAFRRERGNYIRAETGAALIDSLAPVYLGSVIRLDAWSREFQYRGSESAYLLVSLGPDGKADSVDDIVFQNGRLVKGTGE